MGFKRCCSIWWKFICVFTILFSLLTLSLLNPVLEDEYIRTVSNSMLGMPILRQLALLPAAFRHAIDHGPLFIVPIWNPRYASAPGYHSEPGLMPIVTPFQSGYYFSRVSHASVREAVYNPAMQKVADQFITANTSTVPDGYFAPGVLPTLLQLATNDPDRIAHRDLVSAVMPAISEEPTEVPAFKAYPGITASDLKDEALFHNYLPIRPVGAKTVDVFGYAFFRHAFGVELSSHELEQLNEWTTVFQKALINMGTKAGGARCAELAKVFEDKVAASGVGKALVEEATKRGMDGAGHLRKLVFQFVFAGFGGNGPGGALALFKMLKLIEKNPDEYVPLFQKDPSAFVWECLRIHGGGGSGVNPFIVSEASTFTIAQQTFEEKAGRLAGTVMVHANHDPAVFGGGMPTKQGQDAYARAFIPGRENADRILNFVNEPRDIRKCGNMTGCAAAPRFCMGPFLLHRLMVELGSWYVEGRLAAKPKDEM
eukprot:TRINITY_DN22723_c1_g3_i1.p1 TRINITY_DN22723_c1_g3~~TRINITY_DN22723_c1_g3_i1.p1  ORF type:complete len:502 (+),score=66.74 TRINITY_DN22723_c1_g3_i1:56-1507(+)